LEGGEDEEGSYKYGRKGRYSFYAFSPLPTPSHTSILVYITLISALGVAGTYLKVF